MNPTRCGGSAPKGHGPGGARGPARVIVLAFLAAGVPHSLAVSMAGPIEAAPQQTPQQGEIREEILRLGQELESLSTSERGILGELNRLDALARLRQAERKRLEGEIEHLQGTLAKLEGTLQRLDLRAAGTRDRLRLRLRALYRQGPLRHYRLMLGAPDMSQLLRASRHAAALAAADAALVDGFRSDMAALRQARDGLLAERRHLEQARGEAEQALRQMETALARKRHLLASIDRDRQVRAGAIQELGRASSALQELSEGLSSGTEAAVSSQAPLMSFARFKGLLSWPSVGRVSSPFGRILHPRFQTVVPHEGIDIDAPYGADVRAVFDARVAWAGWLSGYGLTLVLDHGGGYMTVSAHASVLMVEAGEAVSRGQVVAKVGDTGSLKGPLLYFEIRKDGRPQDPLLWLRAR